MCRWMVWSLAAGLTLAGVGFGYAAAAADVSAIDDPGRLEILAASHAKRLLVGRSASQEVASAPGFDDMRVKIGGMQFRASCAQCHGTDGRSPTEVGQGLYPRASDLGAPAVQQWSNEQLFWIIKNGIRLTGMPAFGPTLPDDRIWDLVAYVREVGSEDTPREATVIDLAGN